MFSLRTGALPQAIRASTSTMRAPMTRFSQIPQQPTTSAILTSRPFSLLSTPTRFQPSTLGSRLPSTLTTSFSPMSSLRAGTGQVPQQTRSFSASASLGVRRVTFRPSRRVQKRRHGYLARKKDRNGRKTLTRRLMKGRKELSW
ncbi:hypothetical protein PENARI_c007G04292 [Penicillium arizonense]|uniref:Ribosomal protein L34 n=1 Tax=Penicillium arizonense TaxID=1835702 RepID=A0A1F5LKN3_PENAI|nr:hypothetical protein PENARI_c007G04292 [Penicillium arizonense]KAJ6099758.1 hypothetical protein N7467_001293 [Penicillium canescens]OGE53677.1 hypothetical protein PENARI_c007G04292 [Penicillium arizonense]